MCKKKCLKKLRNAQKVFKKKKDLKILKNPKNLQKF